MNTVWVLGREYKRTGETWVLGVYDAWDAAVDEIGKLEPDVRFVRLDEYSDDLVEHWGCDDPGKAYTYILLRFRSNAPALARDAELLDL